MHTHHLQASQSLVPLLQVPTFEVDEDMMQPIKFLENSLSSVAEPLVRHRLQTLRVKNDLRMLLGWPLVCNSRDLTSQRCNTKTRTRCGTFALSPHSTAEALPHWAADLIAACCCMDQYQRPQKNLQDDYQIFKPTFTSQSPTCCPNWALKPWGRQDGYTSKTNASGESWLQVVPSWSTLVWWFLGSHKMDGLMQMSNQVDG